MRFTPVALAIALAACATDSETSAIDSYIEGLPHLPTQDESVKPGERSAPARDGDYSCTKQDLEQTRQYDRIVAYAANSDSLWPGALVAGDSVYTGLFTQMVLPRAPATISVSLESLQGAKSATIDKPSLSAYREALSGILASSVTGATPANIYSEIEQVHSEQQLALALGVDASWGLGTASIKTTFDFAKQNVRSRYVVRFTQAYYTVDLDAPAKPSAVLDPAVPLADVENVMTSASPPLYVSSVTYGRMVLFTFESEYSSTELAAALQFAYSGGVDVSGDVSVTYKDIISKSKITAFLLGGSGGDAVKTIDSYDALIAFIKQGGNYTADSPGAPIAYKLSYLGDNSPARLSFTTSYTVQDCARVSQKVKVTLKSIVVDDANNDSGGDLEIYGNVAVTGDGGSTATLFNRDRDHYVQIKEGAQVMLDNQGVIAVKPADGENIVLSVHLREQNPLFGDQDFGEYRVNAPFELGWRRDITVHVTGNGDLVRAIIGLEPI